MAAREFNFDGRAFTNSLNLKDIQRDIFFNGLPYFGIDLYTAFSKGRPGFSVSSNTQFIDNLTWVRGRHTLKFGLDVRRLVGQSDLGFIDGNNYGNFSISGAFTGYGFADFLLGVPAASAIAVVSRDNDGRAVHASVSAGQGDPNAALRRLIARLDALIPTLRAQAFDGSGGAVNFGADAGGYGKGDGRQCGRQPKDH